MKDRATLITSFVLLSGLAVASYWLAERARSGDAQASAATHSADYFAEHMTSTRMDETGAALYSLAAEHMTHYLDDDSTKLEKPHYISRSPDHPVTHIRADQGQMTSEAEQVHLLGHVELKRAASPTSSALQANTAAMLLLPEQDLARTDQPIQVVQGKSVINAQSMTFDNGYRNLQFNTLAQGRGQATIAPRNNAIAKAS